MKLTEKELNEFPIGTKITCLDSSKNKHLYIKGRADYWKTSVYWCSNEQILAKRIQRVEIPTTYTEYIPPKPILDDKEKEYLSNVIKPWKKKVKSIMKASGNDYEWIRIYLRGESLITLPLFDKGTMYKGMELDREYTLEELRIVIYEREVLYANR